MNVHACALPTGSHIEYARTGSDFADSYTLPDPTPLWMNVLMVMRNGAVRLIGPVHLRIVPPDAGADRTPPNPLSTDPFFNPGDKLCLPE